MNNVKTADNGLHVDIDREAFGRELRKWRIRRNLTQEAVGRQWGMSRWAIMKAENGRPTSWMFAYKMFNLLSQELKKEGGVEL